MDPDKEVMAVTGMFLMVGKGLVVQLAHLLYMGLCALSPKRDCAALQDFMLCASFHCRFLSHCGFVMLR